MCTSLIKKAPMMGAQLVDRHIAKDSPASGASGKKYLVSAGAGAPDTAALSSDPASKQLPLVSDPNQKHNYHQGTTRRSDARYRTFNAPMQGANCHAILAMATKVNATNATNRTKRITGSEKTRRCRASRTQDVSPERQQNDQEQLSKNKPPLGSNNKTNNPSTSAFCNNTSSSALCFGSSSSSASAQSVGMASTNTTASCGSRGSRARPLMSSSPCSASRIRSRFLQSVGIFEAAPPTGAGAAAAVSALTRSRVRPRSDRSSCCSAAAKAEPIKEQAQHDKSSPSRPGSPSQELLNQSCSSHGSEDSEDTASTCSMSSLSSTSILITPPQSPAKSPKHKRQRKSVTFSPTSTCRPIPSRRSYSPRIRSAVWSTPEEMRTSIERNTVEYLSEGWNWRKVLEEEDMFYDAGAGEWIHPVHVRRYAELVRVQRYSRQIEVPRMSNSMGSACHSSKDNFLMKSRAAAQKWSQFA